MRTQRETVDQLRDLASMVVTSADLLAKDDVDAAARLLAHTARTLTGHAHDLGVPR